MTLKRRLSRRGFLQVGSGGVVGLTALSLLSACQPAAPTDAPAATAPAAPAVAAPTAVAPAKPAAAAKEEPKLGKELIGKLEGPEILPDAKRPDKLGEAPMLADLVKQGKLPPLEQRVPLEPMVIKPLQEIGKYGGTWRRGFTGPADSENGNRIISTDKLVFWDYTASKQKPSVARSWEITDGGRTITFFLRKGHKWSDGAPLTADDFMFWYSDVYQNRDLTPGPSSELSINGKPGKMEKVDETTFRFVFPEPYPLFMELLGGSTFVGSSQNQGADPAFRGPIAPAQYLKKFHPKYAAKEDIEIAVADGKYDNWVSLFKFKANWRLNVDLPVIGPWKTTSPINTPTWVLERNPYYYAVDTAGNQLPYFDKIQMTLAENLEVLNLRAIAGEYDWQERHIDLGKLPVILENRDKGNYQVHLDPAANGSDAAINFNQSYQGDPEIQKWIRNRDFRHALALGIDRDQLNETFWLGIGTTGSIVATEESPQNPGPEWRKKWAVLDVKQANELLDKIGLDKKDNEGFRQRTDGKGRLRLELVTVGAQFVPWPKVGEMVNQQLKKIGIQLDVVEQERSLAFKRRDGNEHQLAMWANDGSELLWAFPVHAFPSRPDSWMGPLIGQWTASGGELGMKPDWDPQLLKAIELFLGAGGQDEQQRNKTAQEIWKILAEETYSIGTVGLSPAVMGVRIVKNNVGNVPQRQFNGQHGRTPCSSHPTTLFFKG